jgi:hypothetical protein
VLLWLVDETKPGAKARWVMMVAGDESPLIQAHEALSGTLRTRMLVLCGGTMLIVASALAFGFLMLRRRRAKSVA